MMAGVRLCLAEREEIRVGLERGESFRRIAARLGRAVSTVSREVARGGGRGRYRAVVAEGEARRRACRPKRSRLAADAVLASRVAALLDQGWSPAPVAAQLRAEGTPLAAETIYRELYRPGSVLGDRWRRLCRPRPSKRRRRRTGSRIDTRPLGAFRLIDERPPVDGPGHWQGDLLVGADNRSAAVVLVETVSKRVLLGALESQRADHVADVVARLLDTVPAKLRTTLTWDQGRELARWKRIETDVGIDVYFCHAHSPWQKPLVENTCGLLRRWLPRRSNLYRPQPALDHIAHLLNTMPRRSLSWDTAHNTYNRLTVATTM